MKRRTACAQLFLAASPCVLAQAPARPDGCSNPVAISVVKSSGGTNASRADFPPSVRVNQASYNDPAANKHFSDTLTWRLPTETCEISKAVVSWTVKNSAGDGLSIKETTSLWFNGAALVTHNLQPSLAKGQSRSFSFNLPPSAIKTGRVSVSAQEDLAVTEFKIEIVGCCIRPN
jgi:hypothetical protein